MSDIQPNGVYKDHIVNGLIFTTLHHGSDPAGNHNTELLVEGSTKQKIFSTPGFLKPVPKPSGQPCYVVRSTPDMGLGCFATRAIEAGETIFAERPLLVAPRSCRVQRGPQLLAQYGIHQGNLVVLAEWEKMLEVAVARMTEENRKALMSLANNHTEDGSGPILGIVRTNAYTSVDIFDGPVKLANNANLYSAILKIGSRLNHSCRGNVTYDFDLASFSYIFKAEKDIAAGEQLFYSYCDLNVPASVRKSQLAPYGVVCKCLSCINATPASDKIRTEFEQRVKDSPKWVTNARANIHLALKLRQDMIDEGLEGTTEYACCLQVLCGMYMLMGETVKFQRIKDEFNKYNRLAKLQAAF
ncbi:SET domain-containing protein [Agrocybe pediades]|nr:SET domain-containing protein [Agrocybe pediades]